MIIGVIDVWNGDESGDWNGDLRAIGMIIGMAIDVWNGYSIGD